LAKGQKSDVFGVYPQNRREKAERAKELACIFR
jgi:hypothetical protein